MAIQLQFINLSNSTLHPVAGVFLSAVTIPNYRVFRIIS